jgi:hypothetical protein
MGWFWLKPAFRIFIRWLKPTAIISTVAKKMIKYSLPSHFMGRFKK